MATSEPIDHAARERFRTEWRKNFAVSANAGSGKTTAISERLAAMALSSEAAAVLPKTAVVTFTKKAAQQIGQRARSVLLRRLAEASNGGARADLTALDHLERAFFGTIHSFCLLLARRHGQALGINLNPAVIAEDDARWWEAFLEQDAMTFSSLAPSQLAEFLRHVPLEAIFELARGLDATTAQKLGSRAPRGSPPAPSEAVLRQLLALPTRGAGGKNIELSQQAARVWMKKWQRGRGFLTLFEPIGKSRELSELAEAWMRPLKSWLAEAGATLAAELAERYRAYRFEQGVQTYADQIDAALAVLRDRATLEQLRAEGWRVILDEAQDTDPQQFAVLVELTRPVGTEPGAWPQPEGEARAEPPRAGHFSLVGDAQQAIYGSRADIRNFLKHLEAFRRGEGGELLAFQVTFRAPHRVIALLNAGLPGAFGGGREHNLGSPAAEGAPAPCLQVRYETLAAGPANEAGWVARLPLAAPVKTPTRLDDWFVEEARQVAAFLKMRGSRALGARNWGEVCVLAPRNAWLMTARKVFEEAGLKVALQTRKNRNGDHPVYAWLCGLLAVVCDPDNAFEWSGVLREVFGVSDARLAEELRAHGAFQWEEPERHATKEVAATLAKVRPWILKADDEGRPLGGFVRGLAEAAELAAKARRLDGSGGLVDELTRLLAHADERGLEGANAREWLGELLAELDEGRPSGKAEDDAINLLTVHSAKGLEWPVVVPLGLWRRVTTQEEIGLKLVREGGGDLRVYFDHKSLPDETRLVREREQWRELGRLMYVTFTRPRRGLLLPWSGAMFGGTPRKTGVSFAELWGDEALWASLPDARAMDEISLGLEMEKRTEQKPPTSTVAGEGEAGVTTQEGIAGRALPQLPARVLPHQLAEKPADRVRAARHEATTEEILTGRGPDGDEAIKYGLWWHETMEFMPWTASASEVDRYLERALASAEQSGFGQRGAKELSLLRQSVAWDEMTAWRWVRLTELGVFAPFEANAWMDGVMDLVLHDSSRREVWVLDWKTNRRRADESEEAMLGRLRAEYRDQLGAYARAARVFFPGHEVRLLIFATALGRWTEAG